MHAHASTLNHASKAAAHASQDVLASKVYGLLKVLAKIAYLLTMYKPVGMPKQAELMGNLGQLFLLDLLLKPLAFRGATINSKSTWH